MGTRSLVEERLEREIRRLCLAPLDPVTLRAQVVKSLAKAVSFSGYCSTETDPTSGLVTRMTSDHADRRRGRYFLEHIYLGSEIDLHAWMKKSRRLAFQDWANSAPAAGHPFPSPEAQGFYGEFLSSQGITAHLSTLFVAGGEMWGGLSLILDGLGSRFSDGDVALLGRLAPRIGAALKASSLRELARPHDAGRNAPGVLVLTPHGRVVEYTPAAENWLSDLAEEPAWHEGVNLPEAVWTVVAALRRALAPLTERDKETVPSLQVRGRSGTWLSLQAALAESSGARAGDVVIVIGPVSPREVTWLRTSGYGLTGREQSVVELVMRGASTRQIADWLCISEYTVQDHLSHVFEKVGGRNRRALVKRLYLESWGM